MNDFDTTALSFTVREEITVLGHNPEMADYDNPRGEIYGCTFVLRASNDHGDTMEHSFLSVDMSGPLAAKRIQAEKQATHLNTRWDTLGKLPVGWSHWTPGRPVYGSPAYQAYGQADDLAWERGLED